MTRSFESGGSSQESRTEIEQIASHGRTTCPGQGLTSTQIPLYFGDDTQDKSTGQLSLSLQPSVVLTGAAGDEGGGITWGSPSLKKGLKIKGRVVAVQDFGVFIQLDESEVSSCS